MTTRADAVHLIIDGARDLRDAVSYGDTACILAVVDVVSAAVLVEHWAGLAEDAPGDGGRSEGLSRALQSHAEAVAQRSRVVHAAHEREHTAD